MLNQVGAIVHFSSILVRTKFKEAFVLNTYQSHPIFQLMDNNNL